MSDFPLLMFLTPEAIWFVGVCILAAVWIYLGWINPINKIRDNNNTSKGGAYFQMFAVGILPIVGLIFALTYNPNHKSSTGAVYNNVGQYIPFNRTEGKWAQQNAAPAAPPVAATPQPQMPSAPLSQTNIKPSGAVPAPAA